MSTAGIVALLVGFVVFMAFGAVIEYAPRVLLPRERPARRTIMHDAAEMLAWLSIGIIVVSLVYALIVRVTQ